MLLVTIHVLVCLFLVAVILIQPGKGDAGIGFGSASQTIFGSKGAGNFLTKTTTVCAVVFLGTSFVLTRLRLQEYNQSVIAGDESVQEEPLQTGKEQPSPAPTAEQAASKDQKTEAVPEKK